METTTSRATYALTLTITAEELAHRLECGVDEIEAQKWPDSDCDDYYISLIRDYGVVAKVERIESENER